MQSYYAKRALEILRNEGLLELLTQSKYFITRRTLKQLNRGRRVSILTAKNNIFNNFRYNCPPNPYEIITIQAKEIPYLIKSKSTSPVSKPHYCGFGQIRGGAWPKPENLQSFENYYVKVGFEERFLHNEEWNETVYYRTLMEKFEGTNKHKKHGFDTVEEYVTSKCEFHDDLFRDIQKNGYQQGHSGPNNKGNFGYRERFEVLVTIDATGDTYMWDGRHRLCIAQILDLEIPVNVVCRHKQWQELRDEINQNGLPEEHKDLRDHPDLQDILD